MTLIKQCLRVKTVPATKRISSKIRSFWLPETSYKKGNRDRDFPYTIPFGNAVVAAAQSALDNNEYAWAAQLIDYVYEIDPKDAEARTINANALWKMGQFAMGSIGRAFLLSEARALEGQERILKLVPPGPAIIAADPATYVNYHRVRIDPRKAEPIDKVITFTGSTSPL